MHKTKSFGILMEHSTSGAMLPIHTKFVTTSEIFSNLTGDHIFLQSEPQKSIACHQTFVQGLGTRLDDDVVTQGLNMRPNRQMLIYSQIDLRYTKIAESTCHTHSSIH